MNELSEIIKNNTMPPLEIGDISVPVPIIQGGMGIGISMAGLASAVARSGGIGVIAAVMIGITEPHWQQDPMGSTRVALAKQIALAKEQAKGGVIGVNIMVALQDYDELVKIAASAGADLIISGAGLPLKLPGLLPPGSTTNLAPIVSSGRAAQLICRRWKEHYSRLPDLIVVEGPEAGGHLGFKKEELDDPKNRLENLVRDVIEAVKPFTEFTRNGKPIPVVAAGGVYTGADIYHFIHDIGAAGVQMATRFVATYECDASDAFKEAYLKAGKEDITIIKSPVGLPGRAIKGKFIQMMAEGKKKPFKCPNKCLAPCDYKTAPYCISTALINAQRGNIDAGFVFCGSNVWRVNKIVHVHELIQELVDQYREAEKTDG